MAGFVFEEDVGEALGEVVGDLVESAKIAGVGGVFDFEVVAVVGVELSEPPHRKRLGGAGRRAGAGGGARGSDAVVPGGVTRRRRRCLDLLQPRERPLQRRHREQALERYRQAIELDPQFTDAWNNLGVLLSETGQRDQALSAFRRALASDAQDARCLYNLADTLDEMGRWKEALPYWETYLRMDRTSRWAAHAESRLVAGGA